MKLTDNGLNHKKSFSIIKNSNDNNDNSISNKSNKNLIGDKFPYLSPILLEKQRPVENTKLKKKESKRINVFFFLKNLNNHLLINKIL